MEPIIGIAVGALVVALSPSVPILRDITKTVVKGGLIIGDMAKGTVESTNKHWADMMAEAHKEVEEKAQ